MEFGDELWTYQREEPRTEQVIWFTLEVTAPQKQVFWATDQRSGRGHAQSLPLSSAITSPVVFPRESEATHL